MLESLFNKGVCNFIKKRLQNRCFPVKFAKFLRTSFLRDICERLLLHRGCGSDVDDVRGQAQTYRLINKTQVAKERTDLGPINLARNLFC